MSKILIVIAVFAAFSIATIRVTAMHLANGKVVRIIRTTTECNDLRKASIDPELSVWAKSPWGVTFRVDAVDCGLFL